MDIMAKIEEIVGKLTSDPSIMSNFQKNPTKAIEDLVGVDLPDEQINQIVQGVTAKVGLDQASGILGALGGMLGK